MASRRLFDYKVLYSIGVRRRLTGWLAYLVAPLAVGLAVYVIAAATVLIIAPWALVAIFLCGMMTIAFLTTGANPTSNPERPTLPGLCPFHREPADGNLFCLELCRDRRPHRVAQPAVQLGSFLRRPDRIADIGIDAPHDRRRTDDRRSDLHRL
jgi:uncharacterized membrane protein